MSSISTERLDRYRFNYDGRDPVTAGSRVRKVAGRAHRYYFELIRAYDRRGYNRKVHRITKRQLRDATNELADLITSLRAI